MSVYQWCLHHPTAGGEDRELLLAIAHNCLNPISRWPGLFWYSGDLYEALGRLQAGLWIRLHMLPGLAEDYTARRVDMTKPSNLITVSFPVYIAAVAP